MVQRRVFRCEVCSVLSRNLVAFRASNGLTKIKQDICSCLVVFCPSFICELLSSTEPFFGRLYHLCHSGLALLLIAAFLFVLRIDNHLRAFFPFLFFARSLRFLSRSRFDRSRSQVANRVNIHSTKPSVSVHDSSCSSITMAASSGLPNA